MKYKKIDDSIVVRLDVGEEVISSLCKIAKIEKIKFAYLQGIGATNDLEIGLYKTLEKRYQSNTYRGDYEIVSLLGTLNTMSCEPYAHIHISVADESNMVFGGHLNKAIISATAEIILRLVNEDIGRYKDFISGLNLLDL